MKFSRIATIFAFLLMLVLVAVPATADDHEPTIVDIALAVNAASGEFSTLISALDYAGLVGALDGRGQYTVFAPTDAAFAKLGLDAASVRTLPVDVLTGILLYHVAPGERFSGDVLSADRIRTLSKGFLFPSVNDDGAFVNDSRILTELGLFDIDASNGVIHVIDTVLLPG